MSEIDVRLVAVDKPPKGSEFFLRPGGNLVTGASAFRREFGRMTSLENDLLEVAAAIYAADVGVLRGDRETYARKYRLKIPVVNYHAFSAVREQLEFCLSVLSTDIWRFEFTRAQGTPEEKFSWVEMGGDVLLFSGGLDSLAQAAKLADAQGPFALVSHDSGNPATRDAQAALLAHLRAATGNDGQPAHYSFRVRGQNRKPWTYPANHEPSQRTRSFLFLALGALVARRRGASRLLPHGGERPDGDSRPPHGRPNRRLLDAHRTP